MKKIEMQIIIIYIEIIVIFLKIIQEQKIYALYANYLGILQKNVF